MLYVQQFSDQSNLKPVLYTGTIGSSRFRADLLLLDEPSQLKDATDAVEMPPIRGEVSFFAVSFGYNPDQLVLKGVLRRSGSDDCSGGSLPVLAKALSSTILRFYDVTDGAVKVDGIDVPA